MNLFFLIRALYQKPWGCINNAVSICSDPSAPPESVAAAFGITRNNVDQIKRRLVERLQRLVSAMTEED